jgi:hypothetical protein
VFNCSLLLKKLFKKGVRDPDSIIQALRLMEPSQLLGKGGGSLPRNISPEQREAMSALDETQRAAALEVIVLIMQCSPTPEETAALEAIPTSKRSVGKGGFGPVCLSTAVHEYYAHQLSPKQRSALVILIST